VTPAQLAKLIVDIAMREVRGSRASAYPKAFCQRNVLESDPARSALQRRCPFEPADFTPPLHALRTPLTRTVRPVSGDADVIAHRV
jgi:hypothetical protein